MDCDDDAASEEGEQQTSTDVEKAGQGANINQGRSYECTFCKRGFSNAQALGGHMNIHRKDKAKLKKSPNDVVKLAIDQADGRSNLKWPWNINVSSRDQTHLVHIKQLPLLAETPYSCSCEPRQPHARQPIHDEESTEKGFSSNHASSLDLDLELRLGPDTQDSSPATTRKFF